ncbi:hypothetical protein ABMA28_009244 [Loxostege sticticalis]|uniref:BED-type domain-containing protein n=1 Tax=Loxostege sticticalis TaxID=481309 RepID=A0ABD0SGH3_LOXSC
MSRKSVVWDHFTNIGQSVAVCHICKTKLSFKSSVTNLKKHIDRKHPTVCIVGRNTGGLSANAGAVSDSGGSSSSGGPSGGGQFGGGPSGGGPSGSGTSGIGTSGGENSGGSHSGGGNLAGGSGSSGALRRGLQAITEFMPKRRSNNKNEIDTKIIQMIILDFQPFRIVEDRGFRALLEYAFPNYVIPTRKYFANNMLPALYEKTRNKLKEKNSTEVGSICVTVDIWSTCNNDSMMALTGHYIDKECCTLQSFLLDCVPLEKSHTAKNLSHTIKKTCDEWMISQKILLGVSDNGANIKNAIEKELGWRHFSCFSHTLNLAVTDVLKAGDVTDVVNKIKNVVKHFKKSNVAWAKLKKYQEQAGTAPKRLLQEVPTRWNSTFYMLKRCLELKESLNSAMANLGLEMITVYEWQICKEATLMLEPCEEVTRELCGENYVTGSLLIPRTTGLIKALEQLTLDDVLMPCVEEMRQDLIGGIKNRFAHLSRSRTFTNCMFLDPRFKLYFEDAGVAEQTKQRILAMVAQEQRTEATTSTEDQIQEPSVSSTKSSIWKDFDSRMATVQPRGTAQSRAILEVQRYLDDKIIGRTECPLKWWKEHKAIYPTLYILACKTLNAMALSVPCERIFSAAGNIMTERRTRLGVRKLQQLVFLQQNLKL